MQTLINEKYKTSTKSTFPHLHTSTHSILKQKKTTFSPRSLNYYYYYYFIINYNYITHKKQQKTTKGIQYFQPVTTNEAPTLDSRALAHDLTKVRLSLP